MLAKVLALRHNEGFLKYLKNTSWMMAEQFLRIIAGLFVGIWVARYLGPEQFGIFSYALAFTSIFGGVAKLGLDGIMVRELVSHPEKRDVYLGTAFWLKVIGALLVIALITAIVPFTNNDATTNLFIFIISTGLVFQGFEVVEFYFQSQVLAKIISICKVIQLAISSAIKIYLVISQAELIWFVLVTTLDMLSLAVGYHIAYKIHKKSAFFKCFDISIAKKMLKDCWPMIFGSLALMIQARVDIVMLQEFRGSVEVGCYNAAMKVIEVFAFVPMVLNASLYPAIQNAKKSSYMLYKNRLLNFYRINFIMFIVFALPIYIFSENVVVILFGEAYRPAGVLLSLFSIRLFFTNMGVSRSSYLLSENLMKFSLFTMVLGTIVNVIFNYICIPIYGAQGAILATIASFFVTTFLIDFFYSKTRGNVLLQCRAILTFYKLSFNK